MSDNKQPGPSPDIRALLQAANERSAATRADRRSAARARAEAARRRKHDKEHRQERLVLAVLVALIAFIWIATAAWLAERLGLIDIDL